MRLIAWSERLRARLAVRPNESWSAEQWAAIEHGYWRQWDWPTAGPVKRRNTALDATLIDLIVSARYGGAAFLHWSGGLLSIYQWSRLLSIVTPARLSLMREPAAAALAQLGFAQLIDALTTPEGEMRAPTAKEPVRREKKPPPLVALLPLDEVSPVCGWRPEAGVRAFALVPRKRAEADRRILATRGQGLLDQIAVACEGERGVARLHLIELPSDGELPKVEPVAGTLLSGSRWNPVYFGPKAPRAGGVRFVEASAETVGALVQAVLQKYRVLFPGELGVFGRLYLIMVQDTAWYERSRDKPFLRSVERVLGINPDDSDMSRAGPGEVSEASERESAPAASHEKAPSVRPKKKAARPRSTSSRDVPPKGAGDVSA